MAVRCLIPYAPGTNCHEETDHALTLAGGKPDIVPLKAFWTTRRRMTNYDLIVFPGGFSWGDHFGSGLVESLDLVRRLGDQLQEVRDRRIPILGICNGFQVLVNTGLLPGNGEIGQPTVALDFNQQFRFEHWHSVKLVLQQPKEGKCVWVPSDPVEVSLPVAHGEGRLVLRDSNTPVRVTVTYGTQQGVATYPDSPNGSAIAGICDDTGLVMGLMPHPERRVDNLRGTDGLQIFQAGINTVR